MNPWINLAAEVAAWLLALVVCIAIVSLRGVRKGARALRRRLR